MKISSTLALYSPLLLFCAAALHQHVLSNLSTLSRWKGAGMGMYSEPGPLTRSILVTLEVEGQEDLSFVLRHSEWPDENANARSFPTQKHLEQLMRRITSVKWVYRDVSRASVDAIYWEAVYPEELVIHPRGMRIEVRELVLDLETLSARLRILSSYEETG